MPRGAAALAAIAGLCAVGAVAANPAQGSTPQGSTPQGSTPQGWMPQGWMQQGWMPQGWGALRVPAALLGLLLLWGALSALWAIDPARSLVKDVQLAGLFAAALALAAAARSVADRRRLAVLAIAGTALGLVLACADLGTSGGLSRHVTTRPFAPPRLNQIAVWLTVMLLPLTAFLWGRGSRLLGVATAVAIGATVFVLDGTAAKAALVLSLPVAALLYWRRRMVARVAAALTALAVLTAPLTLPLLADDPQVLHDADTVKTSLGHRFYIWDFAGKRIADRPLLGWGLDSARAIPGGAELIRLDQRRMPLHPHDAPLQVWLELGLPGAALFALLLGWLWLRVATAPWPPLYAAATGGSLAAALTVLSAGWGIWQEWWLATLGLAVFAILAMAPAAARLAPAIPQPLRRGWRACGR